MPFCTLRRVGVQSGAGERCDNGGQREGEFFSSAIAR
jgi:hypothetical protein